MLKLVNLGKGYTGVFALLFQFSVGLKLRWVTKAGLYIQIIQNTELREGYSVT